jgi:hypothetical protein
MTDDLSTESSSTDESPSRNRLPSTDTWTIEKRTLDTQATWEEFGFDIQGTPPPKSQSWSLIGRRGQHVVNWKLRL